MTDDNIIVEKKGIVLAKIDENGELVDGLTEEQMTEPQKNTVKKLVKVL
jgi:hypothetical protein